MLTDIEFSKYKAGHHLTPAACEYFELVRNTPPSRMVGVYARSNVCSFVVSQKMRCVISAESRTAERAFVVLSEYDDRVLELWDQVPPVSMEYLNKNQKKSVRSYTADFCVLTTEGPFVIEVKPEEAVENLLANDSNWERSPSGEVVFRPAMDYCAKLGLRHRVFVYKSETKYRVANLELMMQSRKAESYPEKFVDRVRKVFSETFSLSMSQLREVLELKDYTFIVQLVDRGYLFITMDSDLLALPEDCYVSMSREVLAHAEAYRNRNYIRTLSGDTQFAVARIPGQRDAQSAVEKLNRIQSGEVCRSIRRWKNLILEGEKKGLSPFQSLIPRLYASGNRTVRINPIVEESLTRYLLQDHAVSRGISIYRSYIKYRIVAFEAHPLYAPVGRMTFRQRLTSIPPEVIAFKRGGKRAANAVVEPTDPEKRALKPQLAWQMAAIDHYLADIYLICVSSDGVIYVMRPWITALIDQCTATVLALTISFRAPSRRSCAKVLRECVRQHGCLPREIIVDRGSDFRSVYFAALLAHYGVTLTFRPAGHGRYGSSVERFFLEFKQQWLSQRPGNLADYKEARAVDGKLSPIKRAILRPADFFREIKVYCAWRDSKCRGIDDSSPSSNQLEDVMRFPFVSIPVAFDDEFVVASSVDSAIYRVDFQRGIHIDGQHYWHPDIANIRGKRATLEVRVDPENPHAVYALINRSWVTCTSSRASLFRIKDSSSQFVEGLLIREAAAARSQAKQEADEMLVRLVKEMDQAEAPPNTIPALELDVSRGTVAPTSLFEQIKKSNVTLLRREAWGD